MAKPCKPGALAPRGDAQTILQPGLSVGRKGDVCGTLGLFVVDKNLRLHLLSASHILAPGKHKPLDPITQPAPGDGGKFPDREIAQLWSWDPALDAAIGKLLKGGQYNSAQLGTGVHVRQFRRWQVGDRLEMSGRSSGVLTAIVKRASGANRPANAFVLEPVGTIPQLGDSGAVWYDPVTGDGVGLHHGVAPETRLAIAVSLPDIALQLGIAAWDGTFID